MPGTVPVDQRRQPATTGDQHADTDPYRGSGDAPPTPNKSPSTATRSRTSSARNTRSCGDRHASNSAHDTGADTDGTARARNEYGATVVFAGLFCDQSTNTRPGRNARAICHTTSPGDSPANRRATAFAYSDVRDGDDTRTGAYTCNPFDPDVFTRGDNPSPSNTARTRHATAQHSTTDAGSPGSKSNTTRSGE